MTTRSGAALLEVLVALTIMTTSAAVMVTLIAESARAVDVAREEDIELRSASAFMDAVALWSRADLDRRLGDREQGRWRLRIERTEPFRYEIVLTDTIAGRVLLYTSLFRPERNVVNE